MAIKKQPFKGGKPQLNYGNSGGGGGRRHTMLPQPKVRDSVLSNGSSDRSSSVSDENFHSSPATPPTSGTDLFR